MHWESSLRIRRSTALEQCALGRVRGWHGLRMTTSHMNLVRKLLLWERGKELCLGFGLATPLSSLLPSSLVVAWREEQEQERKSHCTAGPSTCSVAFRAPSETQGTTTPTDQAPSLAKETSAREVAAFTTSRLCSDTYHIRSKAGSSRTRWHSSKPPSSG